MEGSTCSASLNTENSLKKNREMKRKSQGHESLTVDYVSKGDVSPGMCIRKDFYRSVFQRMLILFLCHPAMICILISSLLRYKIVCLVKTEMSLFQ